MMANSISNRCLLFGLLCMAMIPLFAQEAGEAVRIQGEIAEDIYAAGGTVEVMATVEGDVVLAGGRVSVGERITGDVMAAGGSVNLQGIFEDDVRLAGGDIRLSGSVGDDAIAAGGNITLTPGTQVDGRVWLAGGRIDVAGTIGKELKVSGGKIVLSGQVDGNVLLRGDHISILDSAIIGGDLIYHSPHEANITSGAQVHGKISYEPVERPIGAFIAAFVGVGFVVLLSLMLTGILLLLLFPRFIAIALTTIRSEPWKCLGLGLAIFAATPMVVSVLFITVIGGMLAIVVGALYLILLLAGFLTGVFYAGDFGWKQLGRGEMTKSGRLWSFVIALIVISLLGLVPFLGTLLLFALMLLGVGVLMLDLYRVYMEQTGN